MRCIQIAVDNPAARGEMRVFNQFTEQFSVNQLAEMVGREGKKLGLTVDVRTYPNPRCVWGWFLCLCCVFLGVMLTPPAAPQKTTNPKQTHQTKHKNKQNETTPNSVEAEEHYYNAKNTKLADLGLKPHLLGDSMVDSLLEFAIEYKERCRHELIAPAVDWRKAGTAVNTMGAAVAKSA